MHYLHSRLRALVKESLNQEHLSQRRGHNQNTLPRREPKYAILGTLNRTKIPILPRPKMLLHPLNIMHLHRDPRDSILDTFHVLFNSLFCFRGDVIGELRGVGFVFCGDVEVDEFFDECGHYV